MDEELDEKTIIKIRFAIRYYISRVEEKNSGDYWEKIIAIVDWNVTKKIWYRINYYYYIINLNMNININIINMNIININNKYK